ncbi:MAG TPA: ABC transporter ATP-binding protein [Phycisphaerales bacterium]|nr:ABC transporter ATP-binding protein [Phycisphaerales bacterium]
MSDSAQKSRPAPKTKPLLSVRDLRVHFSSGGGLFSGEEKVVKAVDGVGFDINRGETLGIVGESGSGKTTIGRAILRLIPATSGTVSYEGKDVLGASSADMHQLRKKMQIIFQDPAGSLNPRMRIRDIIAEPIRVHKIESDKGIDARVAALLERCGMPASAGRRYPHEFSGGQKQRIGIARSLAVRPDFIVCDEPTSALDVSIQSQIINLLRDLQEEFGLSYMFISHDMAVVRHMCERIAVMYKGKIVEIGERDQILYDPQHEYTKRLLASVPRTDHASKAC